MEESDITWYHVIGAILAFLIGGLTFLGCWWYCIAEYGFLLGVGLGWLPSGITASIVGFLIRWLWGPILLLGLWMYYHQR